jgi:hypothetical protein
MTYLVRTLRAAILVGAVAGCGGDGDGIAHEPVSGTVTLDGKPLEKGTITFTPTEGGEFGAGGVIADGRYKIGRADGPVPGPHAVKVWSRRPTGKKIPSDDQPGTFIEETAEVLPARYNDRSELKADVKKGADNRFDFELKGEGGTRRSKP